MSKYPEHDKMAKITDKSQAIGEFLDWLNEQGIHLAMYGDDEDAYNDGQLSPTYERTESLLSRFFEINLHTIESEKRAMLNSIRYVSRS